MTKVVNIKTDLYDTYIGREGKGQEGFFGNPSCLLTEEDRYKVVSEYQNYFYARLRSDNNFYQRVLQLKGKRLGCTCSPKLCHGHVISRWLDSYEGFFYIGGTGHRFDNSMENYREYSDSVLRQYISVFLKRKPKLKIISGMALGWDMSIARIALEFSCPLIAAIPFEGQEQGWTSSQKKEYFSLLETAESVQIVSTRKNISQAFQERNQWIVDNSNMLLAYFNKKSGGTRNCLRYARNLSVAEINFARKDICV